MNTILHLLTDDEIQARAATADVGEQLIYTAVLTLMNEVRELKRQVKELQHCQCA